MAKFVVISMLVALSHAAPEGYRAAAPIAYSHAAAPIAYSHAAPAIAVAAPAVATAVHETLHAGPAISRTHHEVVGHRTVQVGTKAVQVGHKFVPGGQTVHQPAAYSYVAGEPKVTKTTVPLAAPAIPAPPAPYAAIPPAPRNLGPAPADTVTQTRIQAPVRTHTIVTPQVTRIEPELNVNRYAVEVPVPNPVPVEREVIVDRHVARPYTVEVPQPYAVPQPYNVHPVHQIVETPVIHKQSYSVHQPIVHATHAVAAPAAIAHQPTLLAGQHY